MRVVEVGHLVTRNATEFLLRPVACREYTFHEMIQLLRQKDGFKEKRELGLFQKSRQAFSTSNLELK